MQGQTPGRQGGPLRGFERILVALDGSARAERVLPYVEALAERFGAELTLLRASLAAMPPSVAVVGPDVIPGAHTTRAEREEARVYLEAIAARLRGRGLSVAMAQPGLPAVGAILRYARTKRVDLIAMTTHGRGLAGRLLHGSVADEVLRKAPCPVLLVRASGAMAGHQDERRAP